jgi:hypothetical protein
MTKKRSFDSAQDDNKKNKKNPAAFSANRVNKIVYILLLLIYLKKFRNIYTKDFGNIF